ncbi:MAG: hypothetical protein DMF72_01345 [Acidobacteria bacterium]|nr:MAG: hypothetical protein DMF72_01345 [Acidobacteriota bacterium]
MLIVSLSLASVGAQKKHQNKKASPPTPPACSQGTAYRDCPACGTATSQKGIDLDVLKNRDNKATAPDTITVADLARGSNDSAFPANKQVSVTGYVATVVSGGMPENCNCGRNDLRDIHINIVTNPSEANDQSKYVVVEFTPRWEKNFGLDDSNYQKMLAAVRKDIQGKWIKFDGWTLYDSFHENASKSTNPNQKTCTVPNEKKCNWRATPWEVHPVTAYTKVSAP